MRSPTYATHKLPSFNEMISSQKSSPYNNNNNNHLIESINKSHGIDSATCTTDMTPSPNLIVIPNDDGLAVPAKSASVADIATAPDSNNITVTTDVTLAQSSLFGNTVVQPFTIAKDTNLTYRTSADDIMSMDIIFDNVPIEEDPTIGGNVTIIDETTAAAIATDAIHYEIVDMDGTVRTDAVVQQPLPNVNYSQLEETSNDGILVIDETVHTPVEYREIVLDSGNVLIAPQPPAPPQTDVALDAISEQSNAEGDTLSKPNTLDELILGEAVQTHASKPKMVEGGGREDHVMRDEPSKKTNDGNESSAGSTTLPKRKRKPLPTLIGRNKKLKTEDPKPIPKSHVKVESEIPVPMQCESANASTQEFESPTHPATAEAIPNDDSGCVPYEASRDVLSDESPNVSRKVFHDTTNDAIAANESDEPEASDFMDSLVVVESQDPNDPGKTIHEVYVMCPETKQMSDQPLDLPDEVIQRIRLSMMPNAE